MGRIDCNCGQEPCTAGRSASKNKGKLEKIRFNEEHTCIAVIDESGKESIIMENELNI